MGIIGFEMITEKTPFHSDNVYDTYSEIQNYSEEKEWKPQSEQHVMTQEEWNKKQRAERKQEFAPMPMNVVKAPEVFNLKDFEEPNKSLFFSSKKFKRRNQEVETETEAKGAAIPPPATFDYYGPTSSKQQRPAANPPANLEASISAGLRFLRDQVDKGNKFNKKSPGRTCDE
jgi:hypothetical protein